MSEGNPNTKRASVQKRTHYHQTDKERGARENDPQEWHSDEQEPIRQRNRYDPGRRRPQ